MKVVLFGSGGMVGSRIAAELGQRGHDVTGASRSTGADITDPASVARTATGADAIVSAVSGNPTHPTLRSQLKEDRNGRGTDGMGAVS